MELPHIGQHCSEATCKKLDFLPMKCDACNEIFCTEHFNYINHSCPSAYKKNVQVPVCPLCNTPIPLTRGQLPDIGVGAHIDNDCQSDPAKSRRKVFTNRCSMKGCKTKEIVPIHCTDCTLNFCLKHRHPTDHKCEGKVAALRNNTMNAALSRVSNGISAIQGTMDEDEALARALALSLQDENINTKTMSQLELDAALARQLQQQEQQPTATSNGPSSSNNSNSGNSGRDRCRLS